MTGEELNKGPEAEAVVAVPVDGAVAVAEDNVNANANNVTVGVYQQAVLANQCQPVPEDQVTAAANANAMSPIADDANAVGAKAKRENQGERKDSAAWVYTHWEEIQGEGGPSGEGSKKKYRCIYCKNAKYRHNVTRMRNHLMNCSLAPDHVKEQAKKKLDTIDKRKKEKKEQKEAKGEAVGETKHGAAMAGEMSSKKRKVDAEAEGICREGANVVQAVDSLDLTNEFGRALSELKLGPEAVDTPKLQKFIKKLCPSYDYPSVENMNQVYKMLKLSTETFPTPTENHTSQ